MIQRLNILTRPDDELARRILLQEEELKVVAASVVDLTKPGVDYEHLVKQIFAADDVHVW
ncbi:MAG TPA: hypothetical protein VEH27_00225 [Methylomirabilota bacterium]|nr:hypothetical protein [Methylomirabilota bacterium]